MSKFDFIDGKFELSVKGKLDQMGHIIIKEFHKVKETEYDRIKNLTFILVLTQRFTNYLFLQKILKKFPQLASDSISIEELKKLVNEFNIPEMEEEDLKEVFKPNCKINLIHVYLMISKEPNLSIIKQLKFDNNPFIIFSNILETYIGGCANNSYLLNHCNSDIFMYLYKPEYVTDTIKNYYCTIADADSSILKLLFTNKNDKNKIVSEEENWTFLHVLIWNGSWGGDDEKLKIFNCYQQLVTEENKKIKDNDNRTPLDLYKYVYSNSTKSKEDLAIESLLS